MQPITCLAGAALLAAPTLSHATVVYYPTLDGTLAADSGSTQSLGPVTLDAAAGQFSDPNQRTPDASLTRYYGGTITYTPNSNLEHGGSAVLSLTTTNDREIYFGKPEGSVNWRFAAATSGKDTGITADGTIDFVIKVYDTEYNLAQADIFLGSNATAASEGTADFTVNVSNYTPTGNGSITEAVLTLTTAGWATGENSVTLDGFFSADAWTPAGAAVPEPASLALLGLGGLLALRRRR